MKLGKRIGTRSEKTEGIHKKEEKKAVNENCFALISFYYLS